jgi:hypothetical protein
MLHVATVHFGSPDWIPVQARELDRHLGVPYRTWASLQGIDPAYGRLFDRVIEQRGRHSGKLNHLAQEIAAEADDDDLLIFLDGDAFPIADPLPLIESGLAAAPLLAVRRAENLGDPQPHPCFCVTRVGAWMALPGDWSEGHTWTGPGGAPTTDVGANLLRRLELTGTPWTQVLRSNGHDPHPLFYGLYGDAVYHHGAGFRKPFSRIEEERLGPSPRGSGLSGRIARRAWWRRMQRIARRNRAQSQAVFRRIEADDPGWLDELRGERSIAAPVA